MALIPSLLPTLLAAFTPEAQRGRMLGIVISGQFSGILLSRTFSGLLAQQWGWCTVYALQLQLWQRFGRLRRSCLCQALLFGCFMALWSSMALHLGGPPWRFGPAWIGSFGLVGLVSIAAAPAIGRLVDQIGADCIVLAGVLTAAVGVVVLGLWPRSLLALALGLMAVDLGVQGSFVANQARIDALEPAARSRMSGQLFLTAYLGAAACSAVISGFWATWAWPGTCVFALMLVLLALLMERDTLPLFVGGWRIGDSNP